MSKITQTPSAQSCADKMAYYSLVSQIKRYLPMKMKMGPFFRMAGILFLLSLQLVACSVFGPPPAVTSATATTTTTPGVTPSVVATTTPGVTPSVVATTTPGATPSVVATTTPGATPPVVPGATPPVVPGATPPVAPITAPTPNPSLAFAAGSLTVDGPVTTVHASSLMSMSIQLTLPRRISSIQVLMPDGNTLSVIVPSQTDLSGFEDDTPEVGQRVKVKAIANRDGSFTAATLAPEQPDDPNRDVITYRGVTTSAVEADHVIHFKVGLKSYTFTIPSSADLEDFHGNAQAIHVKQVVKVEVRFHESKGTVIKVGKASD